MSLVTVMHISTTTDVPSPLPSTKQKTPENCTTRVVYIIDNTTTINTITIVVTVAYGSWRKTAAAVVVFSAVVIVSTLAGEMRTHHQLLRGVSAAFHQHQYPPSSSSISFIGGGGHGHRTAGNISSRSRHSMAAVGTQAEPSTGTMATSLSSPSPSLFSQQPSFGLQPPPMSSYPSPSFSTLTGFDDDKYSSSVQPQVRPPVVAYPLTAKRYVGRGESGPTIQKPPYADTGIVPPSRYHDTILIHTDPDDIDRMRYAARLARKVLDMACNMAEPGMTTDVIDEAVHMSLLEAGAYPSPLNYVGFPKSVCSSVNEVICHGIPDTRPLEFGDVVSFDVSCFVNGVHGDNCATVIVGDKQEQDVVGTDWRGVPYLEPGSSKFASVEEEAMVRASRRLVHATRESMMAAINCIGPGKCLSDIGAAIQDVADAYGYSTVEKYRGHGISSEFHIAPFVKHFRNNDKLELVPGMIFTIEPMLVEGDGECFEWSDQWTVATVDGGMAAQFEHTVLITDYGVEILTIPESDY